MPRIFIALLILPFLTGCSEKNPEPTKLNLPPSTTDEQLAEELEGRDGRGYSYRGRTFFISCLGTGHYKSIWNSGTLELESKPDGQNLSISRK